MTTPTETDTTTPKGGFDLEEHFSKKAFVTSIAVGAVYLALTHFGLFDPPTAQSLCPPTLGPHPLPTTTPATPGVLASSRLD